eukprot:TRINITY_DN9769_c0_g1_i1.p3 TRINITY_DN9769_c0_g1~~TRINITY_DN9769_c0_g1_i1.p3  ORF type:complete len:126 (+),score=23.38 TRINITY_DN9769_c0_g1_i1:3-380(+)
MGGRMGEWAGAAAKYALPRIFKQTLRLLRPWLASVRQGRQFRRVWVARKFLYVIATLVVLVIAALLVYRVWGMQLIRMVMVPREPFTQLQPLPADAYIDAKMWIAQIGRAVQQECRDRSRMPSSA